MRMSNYETAAKKSYSAPEACVSSALEPLLMLAESDDMIDPGIDDPWGDF